MLRVILVSIVLTVASLQVVHSQANIGFVTGGDLYQRYVNPEDGTGFRPGQLVQQFSIALWA